MNKINAQQTGGFPLETDTLDALQTAYSIFNALGDLAGNLAIITGCVTSGSTVSDGVVYINGEVLNFKGGSRSSYVIIKEDVDSRVFEDGQNKVIYHNRYVTFGSASQRFTWSSFKRVKSVLQLDQEKESKQVVSDLGSRVTAAEGDISEKADKTALSALTTTVTNLSKKVMPIGGIIMWSGSIANIPTGWVLCDGSDSTPDLRSRFIVGAGGTYNPGDTGGFNTVTLSVSEIPKHKHDVKVNSASGGSLTYRDTIYSEESNQGKTVGIDGVENLGSGQANRNGQTDYEGNNVYSHYKNRTAYINSHAHSINEDEIGGSEGHENRPPYYALAFIMFKG